MFWARRLQGNRGVDRRVPWGRRVARRGLGWGNYLIASGVTTSKNHGPIHRDRAARPSFRRVSGRGTSARKYRAALLVERKLFTGFFNYPPLSAVPAASSRRRLIPLVPKLHSGTHWSRRLNCLCRRARRSHATPVRRSEASQTSAFPSATWERGEQSLPPAAAGSPLRPIRYPHPRRRPRAARLPWRPPVRLPPGCPRPGPRRPRPG